MFGEVGAMFNNSSGFAHCRAIQGWPGAVERMDRSRQLKARAERYRRLAENLFDASIIAVVLACASELEQNAEAMDRAAGDASGEAD